MIPYRVVEFLLTAESEIRLPDFKGSAFRGGFGNIFRKITCVLKRLDCLDCPLKRQCIYCLVFETPPQENSNILNMEKYEKVPHPFVFEPPTTKKRIFMAEEQITLRVLLIGKAMELAPYFVYAISALGKVGLGKGRGTYKIEKINISETMTINLNKEKSDSVKIQELKINAITPIRIKFNRHLVRTLDFHILIRALLRRLSLLYYFHVKEEKLFEDVKSFLEEAQKIAIKEDKTFWYDWERYSSRQNTRMKLGGILGQITYAGAIRPFIPFLQAGEILHVGKGTSFGLGKYEIIQII